MLDVRKEMREFLWRHHAPNVTVFFSYEDGGWSVRKVYTVEARIHALHLTKGDFRSVGYKQQFNFRPDAYLDSATAAHMRNLSGTMYYTRFDKGAQTAVTVMVQCMSVSHALVAAYEWLRRPAMGEERRIERDKRCVLWIAFANSSSGRTANVYMP